MENDVMISKMMINDPRTCVTEGVDGYLLTRSEPALAAARSANAKGGLSVKDVINAAADAASDGAKATSTMIPRVGRATYVPVENVRGHEDAGAKAASIWLKALSESATSMS
jgi:dihydroxyacetone kinase